jgi:hypothetical protein
MKAFADMYKLIIALVVAWLCALPAHAAGQDDNFLAARDAFRAGDAVKLERYARSMNGYVLEPYSPTGS